jgi:hypothetical protein
LPQKPSPARHGARRVIHAWETEYAPFTTAFASVPMRLATFATRSPSVTGFCETLRALPYPAGSANHRTGFSKGGSPKGCGC